MNVFWGELAPSEHIAQFYDSEDALLSALTTYVREGLEAGESAIVIATPGHLTMLHELLRSDGLDLDRAILEDRYISADAETSLASFMVGPWPDEKLFTQFVNRLLVRATAHNRRARAFGEMVALLWARGDLAATVRLEHLWNGVCDQAPLPLFCAYPRIGSTMKPSHSFDQICAAHSRILPGTMSSDSRKGAQQETAAAD